MSAQVAVFPSVFVTAMVSVAMLLPALDVTVTVHEIGWPMKAGEGVHETTVDVGLVPALTEDVPLLVACVASPE